jgi:ArsR family transcriptional regulator
MPETPPPRPRRDLTAPEVGDAVAVAQLLGDRARATILAMLAEGPHCVCEFASALGARENNISNHLARLRDAGLVRASRHKSNGRLLIYERDEAAVAAARAAIATLLR